ncbi:MAG: hypothetical protein K6B28_01155, partial [Lachnospiraceae bacterium]|nr:hypothetical protein [Lachnospiraceae bacterium]
MSLRLILGNAGSGKSHTLFKHIIDESIKNPEVNYIIVVPEQFTLQTQKDIVRLHPRHGILNIDILSFKRLAFRIFEEVGFKNANGALIDDMGKNLILLHVAKSLGKELPLMGENINKLGYITEVKSVISEIMQYNIGDEELSKLIEYSGNKKLLKEKLSEIRVLYNAFRKYTEEKYLTGEELFEKAGALAGESKKLKNSVIAFDGFTGFTPVQYKLMEALMLNCRSLLCTVLVDVKRDRIEEKNGKNTNLEHELFYMSKKTISTLKSIAYKSKVEVLEDISIDSMPPVRYTLTSKDMEATGENTDKYGNCDESTTPVNNRHLIFLEDNLFRADSKVYGEKDRSPEDDKNRKNITSEHTPKSAVNGGGDLNIFSANTMTDEITNVCKLIEGLIRENGYKYHEIAIVTGDLDNYMHILAKKLQDYEIPYFLDKTIPIMLNPCTEFIRAYYSVLINDYSYDSMIRYLRSLMTDIELNDIDIIDNYLLSYGIKGRKNWNNIFLKKRKKLKDEDLIRIEEIRKRIIRDFNGMEENVHIEKLRRGSKATIKTFSEGLYMLLDEKNMENKLKAFADRFEKAGDVLKAREMGEIYEHVLMLLDRMVELIGDEEVTLEEYLELLDAGFDEIRIGIIPKDQDYVQ